MLLPEVENAGARIVADKVRALVEAARFLVDDKEFGCTVSVGVVDVRRARHLAADALRDGRQEPLRRQERRT